MVNPKKKIKSDSDVAESTNADVDLMRSREPHYPTSPGLRKVKNKRPSRPFERPTSNVRSTAPSPEKLASTSSTFSTQEGGIQVQGDREIIANYLSSWTNWRSAIQRATETAMKMIPSTQSDGVIKHFRVMETHFNAIVTRGNSIASAISTLENISMLETVRSAHDAVVNLWAEYTDSNRDGKSFSMDLNAIVEGRVASLLEVLESWTSHTTTAGPVMFPSSPVLLKRFPFTCRWENDFFVIPEDIAISVFKVEDKIVLHRRQAVIELYEQIDNRHLALVKGPPGCGKSTCMFARALMNASVGKTVIWIRFDAKRLLVIRDSGIEKYRIASADHIMDLISKDENFKSEYIYVDQCRLNQKSTRDTDLLQRLVDDWALEETLKPSETIIPRRLYAMTSDGCNDASYSGFAIKHNVYLKPWSLEEYLVVLENASAREKFAGTLEETFVHDDENLMKKMKERAEYKFYFAGKSARFFFDEKVDVIRL